MPGFLFRKRQEYSDADAGGVAVAELEPPPAEPEHIAEKRALEAKLDELQNERDGLHALTQAPADLENRRALQRDFQARANAGLLQVSYEQIEASRRDELALSQQLASATAEAEAAQARILELDQEIGLLQPRIQQWRNVEISATICQMQDQVIAAAGPFLRALEALDTFVGQAIADGFHSPTGHLRDVSLPVGPLPRGLSLPAGTSVYQCVLDGLLLHRCRFDEKFRASLPANGRVRRMLEAAEKGGGITMPIIGWASWFLKD
jgi:hypothetical protein